LDYAVAVWIPDLRIVLLNTGHPALAGLDEPSYEEFVSRTAWHEWGHALGMTRCSPEDVAAGARLLDLAPGWARRLALAPARRLEVAPLRVGCCVC
jgi:hypothetical protein